MEAKANQPKLLEQLKRIKADNEPLDTHLKEEKSRGRSEKRYREVYGQVSGIDPGWIGVQRIVYMHRYGCRPDKGEYSEHHYYILGSAIDDAELISIGIRKHWGIETLHYIKDTRYNEDGNGIRHNRAAAILSIMQDIAINIYRCLGHSSMKAAIIFFANKVNELFKFLSAKHISDLKN